jgi:hypothetical protein
MKLKIWEISEILEEARKIYRNLNSTGDVYLEQLGDGNVKIIVANKDGIY